VWDWKKKKRGEKRARPILLPMARVPLGWVPANQPKKHRRKEKELKKEEKEQEKNKKEKGKEKNKYGKKIRKKKKKKGRNFCRAQSAAERSTHGDRNRGQFVLVPPRNSNGPTGEISRFAAQTTVEGKGGKTGILVAR